ncbi:rhomboid family intramembrane serine protease [Mesorhizobium sp. CAU 1741]|uniref:rhomboid family intramembrane serine protease n=1 Tax=Mesorhizobium sp. CAU 1741 TaxID=3140366 RepID=UPI00325AB51C
MTSEPHPDSAESRPAAPAYSGPDAAVREPVFNLPAIVTAFIALCVAIHLLRSYVLTQEQDFWVVLQFAFIPIRYSGEYALDPYAFMGPWTYSLLHGGLGHLAVNMIWLAAFGSPLANRIGVIRFILFWLVTSLAAVGLHYMLHSTEAVPLVGASGAISGMMGAAARFGFRIDRSAGKAAFDGPVRSIMAVFRSRAVVTFLLVWFAVNLVMGLGFGGSEGGGEIAWEAHIGGFLAGFLLIRLFDPRSG